MTMARSILESSTTRCGVNSTFKKNPACTTWRARSKSESTINPPLRICTIELIASRRGVPGATFAKTFKNSSSRTLTLDSQHLHRLADRVHRTEFYPNLIELLRRDNGSLVAELCGFAEALAQLPHAPHLPS